MKKQFYRVKQLADQTFLRAEKSEVLNHEELQIADQRIEYLRSAISNINKKLSSNGQIIDTEKRMKKCFEHQLGVLFSEESRQEKECQLFQHILKEAGRVEQDLAKEYAEHELKVEEMVCAPLQKVLDHEFPNILKHKRNLSKYCLDKDSATNRYQSTKKETLKDDMEEADIKVEQSRDVLATEMFSLLARENDFSQCILQLLKLQRGYHESALKILEIVIPELEKNIGDSPVKKVFGVPLEEHLRVTGKRLAYPLEICITVLSEYGMTEEGLFRIVGGMSKVKRLKQSLDSGCFSSLIPEYRDVHVLASTLKLYLRELPEPLLTFSLHHEWMKSMAYPENQRLDVVKTIISKLPQENRENLAYLIQFLAKLQHHPENKMSTSSVAIVMAPNLLWHKNDEDNMNMGNCATVNMLLEFFLKEVETLFPDDVSKYVKLPDIIREIESQKIVYVKNSGGGGENDEMHIDTNSPKPNQRKKKPAAPVPPNNISRTDQDIINEKTTVGANYLSGSSTLNRPQKPKEPIKMKTTTAVNTDESLIMHNKVDKPKIKNLVNTDDAITNDLIVIDAQNSDKNFTTTAVHQITHNNIDPRPIAAPRQSLTTENERGGVQRTSSIKYDMSKSLTDGDVTFRKPEIPARPASLQKRASTENLDPFFQKTQCSLYSVANKQQPSIVNIHNRCEKHLPGHDNQIAEKEKFLGHQPDKIAVVPMPRLSLENKLNDINCNNNDKSVRHSISGCKPDLPPKIQLKTNEKSKISKSNEKIDVCNEIVNGNKAKSHVRTRSDGNIVDLSDSSPPTSLVQTPPSPRSLSKPTQPPPPPPNKAKLQSDSTNL